MFVMVELRITADKVRWSSLSFYPCNLRWPELRATYTFDEEATRDLVDKLSKDGINGICATGSIGESQTLLREEHRN